MASTPTLVQSPNATPQSYKPADTTALKTLCTGGASGTKVVAITATSTDSVNRVMQLWRTRSAVSYLLHSQTIATLAGSDGTTAPQNLMANWVGLPVDNDGQPYFFLKSGDTLQGAVTATVTTAKEIDVDTEAGDF